MYCRSLVKIICLMMTKAEFFLVDNVVSVCEFEIKNVLTCVNRMKPGHQSCPAWSANWIDVIISQDDSSIGKSIQVRSWNLIGSVKSHVIPTLVFINKTFFRLAFWCSKLFAQQFFHKAFNLFSFVCKCDI